ncbi:MAG: NADH-quinone oxidoreductase subunit M [Planctomycetota bacterium]
MKIEALSLITFLPALTGIAISLIPSTRIHFIKKLALGISLFLFGYSLFLYQKFDPAQTFQFEESVRWIPQFKIFYHLGIDWLSLLLILLTTFLFPISILCSWTSIQAKGFYISLLFLETGILGAFAARDLFLFYLFWEAMLIPMYLIIGVWGGKNRIYATVKFIIYTMVGSLFMLLAILYLYVNFETFDIGQLCVEAAKLPFSTQRWLFLAFALSFAIKTPLFPMHTWLPDAHVEAPTAGSVILAGVLLKLGVYGFLRFAIPLFPQAAIAFTPLFMTLAVIGILYGALMALNQTDIKKLIAYSSVSHLGFVILGIFSFTPAGIIGGAYQMINHGISTGALFLLVGAIYERTHKRGIEDFGGLAQITPIYATIFMIVTLSSIALPGLNGFVGEFLILSGTFQSCKMSAVFAGMGVVLGAVYMLKLYRQMMFGPIRPEYQDLQDTKALELSYFVPLIVLIFVMGLLPNLFLENLNPFAQELIGFLK